MTRLCKNLFVLLLTVMAPEWLLADESFANQARESNKKVVKVFGAGGFQGVNAYCTGVLISPDGYILSVYSPTLDSKELRVYLYDGTRHVCEMVAAEPALDVALLRIKDRERFAEQPLPFIDMKQTFTTPEVGDWVLAFTNAFEVATRDEPVSLQRGVIAAIVPMAGRRGVTESNYKGMTYILDAITNNPGSNGGLLTNRKGEPLGLIGKEMRNTLSETWVNYAIPFAVFKEFANLGMQGKYKPQARDEDNIIEDKKAYHGISLVPDLIDRTPPYVEDVANGSPAALAGLQSNDLLVLVRHPRADSPTELEEKVVLSTKTFKQILAPLAPGTKVKLIIRRDAQLLQLEMTLGK